MYVYLIFNDILALEVLTTIILIFYVTSINLLTLLYVGGVYLLLISFFLFLNDLDIYVGFLLVIDLGVGLVFFIFILHFTSFLYQKSAFNIANRYYIYASVFFSSLLVFMYYNALALVNFNIRDFFKVWFYKLVYTDYYLIYNASEVTELNLLLDSYFNLNTWEFFIINFHLLFGLISAIILFFLLHRVFNFLNYSQLVNFSIVSNLDSNFFIKSQSLLNQTSTRGFTSVWVKPK